MSDLISRADAIEAVLSVPMPLRLADEIDGVLRSLPSADAVSREEYEDIIKDYRKQYENMNNEIADLEAKLVNCVEVDRTSEWVAVRREEYEDLIADAVQGEWIWRTDIPIGDGRTSAGYICSNCGKDYWHGNVFDFCPNCGARMKGGAE